MSRIALASRVTLSGVVAVGGSPAAVTIVLADLSGSTICPPYCHTFSAHLMDLGKDGCLTTYFSADIFLS